VSDHEFHVDIAAAAQLACLLEASAPKPGNVSPGINFGDTTYEDFLASGAAIGIPLGGAGSRPVGATIHLAVQSTRAWANANTNLGIVLLLAPLARAAAALLDATASTGPICIAPSALRASLQTILAATTVDDARDTYAAIRLASPGGLGSADHQDVSGEPTVTLTDAMRLAADRDGIAREYATNFQATFETGTPALVEARRAGLDWNDAIVQTYLTLLAAQPDTHITRRAGRALADDVTRQARHTLERGGVLTPDGRAEIARMSASLRDARNHANPGTTADITAAAIFVALLGGAWQSTNGGFDGASR
jgi:triphosphoribosyl-dephospho-CoA synthase